MEGRHERFHPEEAPANEIHIENAVNTQIQQGTPGSTQEMTVSDQTVGELHAFVGELRGEFPKLGLAEVDQEVIRAATAIGAAASPILSTLGRLLGAL